MNISSRFISGVVSLFVVSLLLISCGGGGGGGVVPADPAPTITSFVSSAAMISSGSSVNLTAVFANGTGSIDNGVGSVTSGVAVSVSPASTKIYTLTVTNASGLSVTATVTVTVDSLQSTVGALYLNFGANWNDYVVGENISSASDSECFPADTSCIHGGELRTMDVPGRSSCTGLTASDTLGAFEWVCDASGVPVRFISTGFKQGKGLNDLIDFAGAAFLENALIVSDGATQIAHSLPAVWWSNLVVVNNDGSTNGSDMSSGEIHIVTSSAGTDLLYVIGAERVALVVEPGKALTFTLSPANGSYVINSNGHNFLWFEGDINAASLGLGGSGGIFFGSTNHSVLHNVTADNSAGIGVHLFDSDYNSLSSISVNSNKAQGLFLESSSYNLLMDITATANSNYGVDLLNSQNTSFSGPWQIQNNSPNNCNSFQSIPGLTATDCTPN